MAVHATQPTLPRKSPNPYRFKTPSHAIVTIEPGIYLEGWGGVRLEDMALVRADGIDLLTDRNPAQILQAPTA